MQAAIQHEIDNPHVNFEGGARHAVEVDYHKFRKELSDELRSAGVDMGKAPPDRKGFRYVPPPRVDMKNSA